MTGRDLGKVSSKSRKTRGKGGFSQGVLKPRRGKGQPGSVPRASNVVEPLMGELIECPFQPGSLRISRRACALRYFKALETKGTPSKSVFDMVVKDSLEICLGCPEGRLFAEKNPSLRVSGAPH